MVFRRARKKLNGKREKYNIGLKRGGFSLQFYDVFSSAISAHLLIDFAAKSQVDDRGWVFAILNWCEEIGKDF